MTKELIALSFEFRLTCENVLFASTAALGFIFMCFVFIFCLGYNVVSVHCGFKRKLDKETSTHLYDKDKSLPERNRQQSSEKYRRNIKNIRKSILRELVPEPGKIIAADVQRHPSQKFTKNQLHVQQIQNNLHSNAATRNHDHIGQRNPNRFQTRPVDFAACSPVKNCPAIDADSPVISKPSDKTVVCKVHRTQRNLNRFHKREEDENPWTEEKLYLPSHTDSIDVFKSCDKTDVREDEYPEEQDWETGSDDIENTSSAKEVDSDIQSISDCINDPYGDSNSFLLQASNDSDLETDAILNNGPREKCDTEYLRSNSDMEPGKYIPDRGRRARSKQDIRNKRYASIRKKKKSCPSSAKKSEETIIRAENIMIGKHNKLILSEDIKLDNIKQTLDNIKQTLDGFEESMKIKIEKLSAIVLEVSRKPNRIHSECTGIGIVPAPCNCGQYVANVASKIRHCQKCNLKQSSAQGLQYSHGDSSSLFMHSLFNNAIPIDASAKEENTDYMRTKSDMRLGNYVQDRETNRLKSKKLQMGKTKMIKVSSPKRSEETAMRGENGIVGTPKALISTAFEKWDDTSGTKTDSNSDFPPDEFLQLLE